jgi:hypothetical protein
MGVIHISACGLSAFFHLMLLFSASLSGIILGLRVYSDGFVVYFLYFHIEKNIFLAQILPYRMLHATYVCLTKNKTPDTGQALPLIRQDALRGQ